MFERFTERARQAVVAATNEARELRHREIVPEHLVLGLLRDDDDMAARVLASLEVTYDQALAEVTRRLPPGEGAATGGQMPFTAATKQVLERALHEALALGHNYIGTEHLLLGLAVVEDGEAIEVLRAHGVDAGQIRDAVVRLLSGGEPESSPPTPRWPGRRPGQAPAPPPAPIGAFQVGPGDAVIRLLASAAARALEDGRTEFTAADLVIALARSRDIGPVLAELGAGETQIRAALERIRPSKQPPEPSAGTDG